MPSILFTKGPRKGENYSLSADGLVIGRADRCGLLLDHDENVSAEHARIHRGLSGWCVEDLGSSNGTLVNGAAIAEETPLNGGDYVGIGASALQFIVQDSDDRTPATSGPAATVLIPERSSTSAPVSGENDAALVEELNAAYATIKAQLAQAVVGQEEVIEQMLISVFCRGHALLMGVPGLAKTLLVSTLSKVLELSFKRIQFTPDLMPADITGTEVMEEDQASGARSFRFVKGPLFANMVLADEINRTPPKTQAALLEAMQEHHITVGDTSYDLPEPFFVLATQNPIEQEGTYPLPEAQLDRFLFNIVVGYPTEAEEQQIIKQVTGTHRPEINASLDGATILRLQELVRRVPSADHVVAFAAALARASRPKEPDAPEFVRELVGWGAGPRAGINLISAAKARAVLRGRFHATTEDVKAVALPVLRHRIITTFNAEAAGVSSDDVVRMLLDHVEAATKVTL